MAEIGPDLTAMFDQQGAFLASVAPMLGQYMRKLVASGFTREEATLLVIEYQRHFFDTIEEANRGKKSE